jgi:hypothetical protein
MVTEPKIEVEFSYVADCPFCGDSSYPERISGGVYIGPSGPVINTGSDLDTSGEVVRLRTMLDEVNRE